MRAAAPFRRWRPPLAFWRLEPLAGRSKRDFLSLADLTVQEIASLLDLAASVKSHPAAFSGSLEGRAAALIFEKPSLRTRVTFEIGLRQLGAHSVYLSPSDIALGRREPPLDVARNLACWVDALVVRTFAQQVLEEMAQAEIPVINALSDLVHPCQAIADLLALREAKENLSGLRVAFIGDGNNVAHSLMHGAAKTGIHLSLATPAGFEPAPAVFRQASADAEITGAEIRLLRDPAEAVRDADAVYTDVWTSMGREEQAEFRKKAFAGYCVDSALFSLARPDAVFMHCLPAHRGEEVTSDVLDGPRSIALEQARNRLPAHQAILLAVLAGRRPLFPSEGGS